MGIIKVKTISKADNDYLKNCIEYVDYHKLDKQ